MDRFRNLCFVFVFKSFHLIRQYFGSRYACIIYVVSLNSVNLHQKRRTNTLSHFYESNNAQKWELHVNNVVIKLAKHMQVKNNLHVI